MTEKPLFYQNPEEFYIKNEAYIQNKELFDRSLAILKASDDLKVQLSGYQIDNAEQEAISRIFLKGQALFYSIVKLCNEGRDDIAKILCRSLFENFVNAKFIVKHQQGEIFIDYRVAATKKFYDSYESKFPDSRLLLTEEFKKFRIKLDEMFKKVEYRYTDKNGRILNRWSKKDLRAKSSDIGELLTYDYIMGIYSAYVHCDPGGNREYVLDRKNETIFDNNPRIDDVNELLTLSSIFFRNIIIVWADAFNAEVPKLFMDAGSSPG